MSLPRKTFARKIINMIGYSEDEQINEVAYIDEVSQEEAARRVAEAKAQSRRRSVAQFMRHCRAKDRVEEARRRVLSIAHHEGRFLCESELENIAYIAQWRSPTYDYGYWDTGRVFREICRPLEKDGLIAELRNEDERFIGYVITEAGKKVLLGG